MNIRPPPPSYGLKKQSPQEDAGEAVGLSLERHSRSKVESTKIARAAEAGQHILHAAAAAWSVQV